MLGSGILVKGVGMLSEPIDAHQFQERTGLQQVLHLRYYKPSQNHQGHKPQN